MRQTTKNTNKERTNKSDTRIPRSYINTKRCTNAHKTRTKLLPEKIWRTEETRMNIKIEIQNQELHIPKRVKPENHEAYVYTHLSYRELKFAEWYTLGLRWIGG